MSQPTKGVRTQHPEYAANLAKWQKCNDGAMGESAVHDAGETYLPKLREEDHRDYTARLNRAPFFNATWRTIAGLRGMMFRKPGTVELPTVIDGYTDNIDAAGTPLQTFAQKIVERALTVGRVGIMVDQPPMPDTSGKPLTVAAAQALGMRPSLKRYDAEHIINWRTTTLGNVTVLSMVVLQEAARVSSDEFGHETEARYRVLDLTEQGYRQRLYRIDAKGADEQVGGDVYPQMAGRSMPYIPFVFVGVDETGPQVEEPPLMDLIDMNFYHYTVGADYEHGCHFSGLPTLFISGYQPSNDPLQAGKKIYIGGPHANCLPDPQAKAYFVEITSAFIALRTNLEDKKAQMAVLGARMLEAQKIAAETAETAGQHRKGEESLLAGMATTISLGLWQALQWMADWAGGNGAEVVYELNKDYGVTGLTAQQLTALVTSWIQGAISHETLFDNLQQHEVIRADVTFEQEQGRIGDGGPKLSVTP